jgi:acetyl/propionyl-CoA carboxylase alpha subunit
LSFGDLKHTLREIARFSYSRLCAILRARKKHEVEGAFLIMNMFSVARWPFQKVLIANRGEIALRVIRACRELGLSSVAVYSDVDRDALHVRMADEAYHIGPAQAAKSYLNIPVLIDVAKRSGAQAVHPGYGFLSENAAFVKACEEAGLIFVGPPVEAQEAMGEKTAARRTAQAAGVPIVPGAMSDVEDDAQAQEMAKRLGYPILLKAAAGGGGKGIRFVRDPKELLPSLRLARSEARSAFGDGRVYLEKAITPARHIEVQFIADTHGNVVHLCERECSVQRRHQKLVEETPSPAVDEELRARIRVAAGLSLSFTQEQITLRGSAIECRISAEDPENRFLPATGTVLALQEPSGPGVRVDSGLYPGLQVPLFYDPLLSKLIVWGRDRAQAIARMRRALAEYQITGVRTTLPFSRWLMEHPRFIAGDLSTDFIAEEWDTRKKAGATAEEGEQRVNGMQALAPEQVAAIIGALLMHAQAEEEKSRRHPLSDSREEVSRWREAGRREILRRM